MNECIPWQGRVGNHGYGVMKRDTLVHRHVYQETLGEIPEGKIIHHDCENKLCMNPAHMILVTRSEHATDYDARSPVKTHCVHGHEIAVVGRINGRRCRACHNEAARRKRALA